MPAPQPSIMFSAGVAALERIEQARKQREDQMRNALEILADRLAEEWPTPRAMGMFVRATAREGLGRESGEHGAA